MKNLKELREERAAIGAELEAKRVEVLARAEGQGVTDEDKKFLSERQTKLSELESNISFLEGCERAQHVETPAERAPAKPGRSDTSRNPSKEEKEARAEAGDFDPKEDRNQAIRGWALHHAGQEVPQECIDAAKRCRTRMDFPELEVPILSGNAYRKVLRDTERRSQSNLNLALGGATVPEGFVYNIETALLAYGGMRDAASVLRTDTGNPLPWPTVNDTSNKGTLLAENTSVSTTDVSFGNITFNAYKFSSNQVLVPVELLQDAAFNLEQYCGELLGIRLARILNDKYTTGSGAAEPNGIATAGTSGRTATSATAISMDDVINLIHSVDPLYRPNAKFMCHDNTKLQLRQLKDGFGQYLWQNGDVQSGIPDSLFGYPVITNQSMDSTIASGKKSLFFGEWKKFQIREVGSIRLVVMRERYADLDQLGMVAFMRADSNLLDAGTHPIKYITH